MRLNVALYMLSAVLLGTWAAQVSVPIANHWSGGFQGDACFTIDQEMSNGWTVTFHFDQPISSLEVWVADVSQKLDGGKTYVLTNKDFNSVEHIGDQLCINFLGHGSGDINPVVTAEIVAGHVSVTAAPAVTAAPGQTLPPTTPTTPRPTIIPMGEGIYSDIVATSDSGGKAQIHLSFPIQEDVIGWLINVTFTKPVTSLTTGTAEAYSHSSDGLQWSIVNKPYVDDIISAGRTLNVLFDVQYTGSAPIEGAGVLINMGVDPWRLSPDPLPTSDNSKYNYDDSIYKSILFYEAQRSGKLPPTNRIPWRGDSALGDKGDNGEDLTGGWYDAGDHIKFNFPMAYTTTALAWSIIQWKDAYEAAGQLDWALDSIKWPLDYFIKCHTGPTELYVQVGDAGPDHSYWGAPEQMTMARPAFKITASNPGSDVAMETAAAMAAGYLAFKDKNPSYAATLLSHAKELWEFGNDYHGFYSTSVPEAAGYYRSNNYTDELCWGSNWLYKATGDQKYLDEAERQFDPDPAWGESWDEKTIGNQVLLYEATGKDNYKQAIINSYKSWFPGGDITYTPKGLAWRLEWGSLRYSSNMAMAALVAADLGINPDEYRHWAMCMIHYVLGDTGFSYQIGFGDNYPQRPHHRSSSCPVLPAPCSQAIASGSQPNIHILYGAMVGGPGSSDDYTDDRTNYVNNEVACDYNAGFQGAVAGLKHAWLSGEHPEQTGSATCPYS